MTHIRPMDPAERDAVITLIQRLQRDPATACGYLGDEPEDVATDLDDYNPDWSGLAFVAQQDGVLVGAAFGDCDETRCWLHGPWVDPAAVTPGELAPIGADLVRAIESASPVSQHEIFSAEANETMAATAALLGWDRRRPEYHYAGEVAAIRSECPAGYAVRPARRESDFDTVSAMFRGEFPTAYCKDEALFEAPEVTLVAVADATGEVVGFASGHPDNGEAYVDFMVVLPEHRGRGLGRHLLAECAAAVGGERFRLEVGERNQDAIRLYDHLGMERLAVMQDFRSYPA